MLKISKVQIIMNIYTDFHVNWNYTSFLFHTSIVTYKIGRVYCLFHSCLNDVVFMWLVPRLCMIGLRIGLGLRVGLHDWVQDQRETYSCTDKTDKHENKAIGLEVQ